MSDTTSGDSTGNEVQVLAGIRVVELTMWIAGPSAGGLLADWGADVIKVEPPSGDPQRNILGAMGYGDLPVPGFALDNRGKRSVALDLATDEGRTAMEKLLETADVFLTNMLPSVRQKLRIDVDDVRAGQGERQDRRADVLDGLHPFPGHGDPELRGRAERRHGGGERLRGRPAHRHPVAE